MNGDSEAGDIDESLRARHIPELYSWDSPPPTRLPDVAPIRLPPPAPPAAALIPAPEPVEAQPTPPGTNGVPPQPLTANTFDWPFNLQKQAQSVQQPPVLQPPVLQPPVLQPPVQQPPAQQTPPARVIPPVAFPPQQPVPVQPTPAPPAAAQPSPVPPPAQRPAALDFPPPADPPVQLPAAQLPPPPAPSLVAPPSAPVAPVQPRTAASTFEWLTASDEPSSVTPSIHNIADLHIEAPVEERSPRTPLEIVAIIAAIVLAPIGVVLGIVAVVQGRRQFGYVPTLAKAAIIVGSIVTVIGIGGGVAGVLYEQHVQQQEAIRVASQPLCTAIASKPGILSSPSLEWPALTSSIPQYTKDITAYAKYWSTMASRAPAGIASQVKAIAAAAQGNVDRLNASKVVETDQDVANMTSVASASTLPAWVAQYCG